MYKWCLLLMINCTVHIRILTKQIGGVFFTFIGPKSACAKFVKKYENFNLNLMIFGTYYHD